MELSAHLGHADPSITMSTYAHEFERSARGEDRRSRIAGMYSRAANSGVTGEVSGARPSADPEPGEAPALGVITAQRG